MKPKTFTTTAVARLSGVHVNTVKNYSKRGVLTPTVLTDGTRTYGPEDLARMRELAAKITMGRRKPAAEGDETG